MTTNNGNSHSNDDNNDASNDSHDKERHIVFLHLDLGIGGAEQLIVNLALASLRPSTRVSILTTHCNPSHCFDTVRPNSNGRLSQSVFVYGSFLPVTICGYGTALCSTLRLLYLCIKAVQCHRDAQVMVMDVLPTPIPYLIWRNVPCVIYYCHFPDKLLTRDTVNGVSVVPVEPTSASSNASNVTEQKRPPRRGWLYLKGWYRRLLDALEESTMSYADLICVNSKFTKEQVSLVFPSLQTSLSHLQEKDNNHDDNDNNHDDDLQVLYPAIDLSKFIPPNFEHKQSLLSQDDQHARRQTPIVSLNRFERKKNIPLLLYAYAKLLHKNSNNSTTPFKSKSCATCHNHPQPSPPLSPSSPPPLSLPPLIIAGGYDLRNSENVSHLLELKSLAQQLDIHHMVQFRPSVSDDERATLLQSALCVVYTPYREHFGIVPLEAMFAGSAVLALDSGGPKETIVNNITGILVPMSHDKHVLANDMAHALERLLQEPQLAIDMGKRGHKHVKDKFGMDVFRNDWNFVVNDLALPKAQRNRQDGKVKAQMDLFVYSILGIMVALVAVIGRGLLVKT